MRITEEVRFENCIFVEDIGGKLIKNVVLLGPVSKHGYTYKESAMRGAVNQGKYNNVRVFVNHPTRDEENSGRRNVMSLAGMIEAACYEGGKIRGDVRLLDDEYGLKFWNIAKTMPQAASCSHIADGVLETDGGGKRFVSEIRKIESVDLVIHGATTSSVFESHDSRPIDDDIASGFSVSEPELSGPDFDQACQDAGINRSIKTEAGQEIEFG